MRAILVGLSGLALVLAVGCGDSTISVDASPVPQCSDGIDNDGDGTVDFPDDLGCTNANDDSEDSPAMSQCQDGRDNDGDGKIDYPDDPGCFAPQADSETDDCPDGPNCPQCADGVDNDGNGTTDYPNDQGCDSASDNEEFPMNSVACGAMLKIETLPASGIVDGDLDGTSTSLLVSPCGGGGGSPARAYVLHLDEPKVVELSTDYSGTSANTIIDLRNANCMDQSAEIACSDDISTSNSNSKLTTPLQAGNYYIIVSGVDSATSGTFHLEVKLFSGEGTTCTSAADCGPGLVCRTPLGGSSDVCSKPVCSDGLDDDGDGKSDYPNDPGCASPDDDDETDDCPSGPNCPDCADGQDNDGDGMTDYPDDTTCKSAGDASESCPSTDGVTLVTTATTSGTTAGAQNDVTPPTSCVSSSSAPDLTYRLDVPPLTSLHVTLDPDYDGALLVFDSTCSGAPLACDDNYSTPEEVSLTDVAGSYYVVVDGYSSNAGTFSFTVSGEIVNGESCEGVLAQSGALTCGDGYACRGTAGSRTCQPAACNDGVDNDGDGKVDYPNDPGCATPSDNDEVDDCPSGPSCPACSDGIDNDGDGMTDYPNDTTCSAAGGVSESCVSTDGVTLLTQPMTMGDTSTANNDVAPSCAYSSSLAGDQTYRLDLPALTSLDLEITSSSDTVTVFYDSTCGGTPIQCSDPSLMHLDTVAAGTYYFVVDGYYTTSVGPYTLNVAGKIQNGGSCEGALAQSGALTCGPGFACNGVAGSRTCQPAACNDGIDNDADGKADYPNDPGCASPSDNDEADDCPSGPSCPACADGLDNDGDGMIDYPNDPTCQAASGVSEACLSAEGITVLTQPMTTGDTSTATNDVTPTCGASTNTAKDLTYRLDVPALTSLDLDLTQPSYWDSTTVLYNASCGGTPVQCSDPEDMHVDGLAAGTYYFVVDGYSSSSGAFTLNVAGTIVDGESCESALAQSGALTCGPGYACRGTAGSRTCQPAACNDGIDDDGDGKIDYPEDPGCATPSDDDETDDCPSGPNCPACSDGVDNDGDGMTDYPDDLACQAAGGVSEACVSTEGITVITTAITSGTTAGAQNDVTPPTSCASSSSAPDLTYRLDVPALTSLDIDLDPDYDAVLSLFDSTCAGATLACDDHYSYDEITLSNLAAGSYYVVVDGYSSNNGTFSFTVSGTIANGESCESALAQAGALTCGSGYTCSGTPGSRTCQP